MILKWFALTAACAVALFVPSCAHDRQLVDITIHPGGATFTTPDPASQVQFSAIGSFVHPPEKKDITSQVTWKTDIPQLITVNAGVVSPTGAGCGIADISASFDKGTAPSGNLVIAYATVTVKDPTDPLCPGGTATQAVLTVALTGSGTVISSPAGIDCPKTTCGAQFPKGSSVVLTATPNTGSTFVGWGVECPSPSGNTCPVVLNADTSVSATFNP